MTTSLSRKNRTIGVKSIPVDQKNLGKKERTVSRAGSVTPRRNWTSGLSGLGLNHESRHPDEDYIAVDLDEGDEEALDVCKKTAEIEHNYLL